MSERKDKTPEQVSDEDYQVALPAQTRSIQTKNMGKHESEAKTISVEEKIKTAGPQCR